MLLHEGLTRVHSQKKARLHFGESLTLTEMNVFPFKRLAAAQLF